MNLRARVYVERQKKDVEEKLAARLATLKGKGDEPRENSKRPHRPPD